VTTLRTLAILASGVLAVLVLHLFSDAPGSAARAAAPAAGARGPAAGPGRGRGGRNAAPVDTTPRTLAPYFIPATAAPKPPDREGFLQRWVILEPINLNLRTNTGFNENYVRTTITKEYFPNQFTGVPHDGDQVTVGGEQLAWHAVDSTAFNVKLFRFAYGLNKTIYGVMFWSVTVVNSPRELKDVRLAVGSNSASMWWVNGKEAVGLFGDRRMVADDCVSKRITLNKGANVIRGAVINGPGMSDFCVRFLDENGEPVRDLTQSFDGADK